MLSENNRTPFLLGVIALLLYLPAIGWGLPHATNPQMVHGWDIDSVIGIHDLAELYNLFIASQPEWWLAYPLFHYLLVGLFYTPYLICLVLTGQLSSPTNNYPFGLADPVQAIYYLELIGRLLTVTMASGIIVSVYSAARTTWNHSTGILAATATMLMTPMVYYARTGNLDVPVLFWLSLSLVIIAKALKFGFTVKRSVLLGIVSALAVATKDQAYGALLPGLLALCYFYYIDTRDKVSHREALRPILALMVSGLLTFLLASGIVLSPHRFIGHISFLLNFKETFYNDNPPNPLRGIANLNLIHAATPAGYAKLFGEFAWDLFLALGPVLPLGLAGFITSWSESRQIKILAIMFVGSITLVIVPVGHTQYRYAAFPALALSFCFARAVTLGLSIRHLRSAVVIVMLISGFWLTLRAIDLSYQMVFDARYEAGQWLARNSRPRDKVAYFGAANILPPIPLGISLVRWEGRYDDVTWDSPSFLIVQPDYSSVQGDEHNEFMPEEFFEKLKDGKLGYQKVAAFETAPLFPRLSLKLPLVRPVYLINPPVQIYEMTN